MSRRSRPPRTRKSRAPEAARRDVTGVTEATDMLDVVVAREAADVETLPTVESAGEEPVHDALASSLASEPSDELAALDAGWD
jgi:hypothetical protein